MLSRRQLFAGAIAAASTAVANPSPAAAGPIIINDPTQRVYGPVMFIGDSTSSLRHRTMRADIASFWVGPFRLDLQPGRSISRKLGSRPSAVESVRSARKQGFDPPTYVIALGFPDIIRWERNARPATSVTSIRNLIIPLLDEIGDDRRIAFFDLYSVRPTRAETFNAALASLAAERDNLLVVPWSALARRHRNWHKPDGYHYNGLGSRERTNFIGRTLREMVTRSTP